METNPCKTAATRATYGQAQALKVLLAEKLGLSTSCADTARQFLEGKPVSVIFMAQIEGEGVRIHNEIAKTPQRLPEANQMLLQLAAEFSLAVH